MRKAGKVLLVILAVLAISGIVGWVAGPEAAGGALLMMAAGLGAFFGAGWAEIAPQRLKNTDKNY